MTDYTKDQFISELAIFATSWVDEKMVAVMEKTDELWENEFTRTIVKNHALYKREADVNRRNMAIAIANGDRLSYETNSLSYKLSNERRSAYSSVLYDLLVNNGQ